jgi:hypothetical protein
MEGNKNQRRIGKMEEENPSRIVTWKRRTVEENWKKNGNTEEQLKCR